MSKNILQYESKVFNTANLLISSGIKQSDFPKYMMPFFALVLVESRILREANKLLKKFGVATLEELDEESHEAFVKLFQKKDTGYNALVIEQRKTLKEITKNDTTFETDFHAYLKAFDKDTQALLGVDRGNEEEKFLDISGMAGQLKKKGVLFDFAKDWSQINLLPYNNSEITTLEEHIKRKWADISAETAGEQFTPSDVIALIAEIVSSKIDKNAGLLTIYDLTCGGGNLLYGVEDSIKKAHPNKTTKTYGQDWNDTLYALAKIESRFRGDSDIRYGNTLTTTKFDDKEFDVIIANPPYGVDWKGYRKDIETDETGRFVALPSVSDGQMLFTQHILAHLSKTGIAVVVHNGSTLFSGDAGSGESNIRKYFFDNDWVEAIIQLPTDEFFNTGIHTYLWVFNKQKAQSRKDKVMLIDAKELYQQMQKSKGNKRKEMLPEHRAKIVEQLTSFEENEFSKVFDKWHFYYNKQTIQLTNIDHNGKSFEELLPEGKSSIKLNPVKVTQGEEELEISIFEITDFDKEQYDSLKDYYNNYIKDFLNQFDYKEENLSVHTQNVIYSYDAEKETLLETAIESGEVAELGCGQISIKPSYKKKTKTKPARIEIKVELKPDYEKDYEIIPYHPNEEQNQQAIEAFMDEYIIKPFEYLDNLVGVEINFNKTFYKKIDTRPVANILKDLSDLEEKLSNLENTFSI